MFEAIRCYVERARKGYCFRDLWSFDNWLSKIIANGLKEFKENVSGYPSETIDWEEWMDILDEMIECFEEQSRRIDNFPEGEDFIKVYEERMKFKREKLHRGLELLEKYFYDLWD